MRSIQLWTSNVQPQDLAFTKPFTTVIILFWKHILVADPSRWGGGGVGWGEVGRHPPPHHHPPPGRTAWPTFSKHACSAECGVRIQGSRIVRKIHSTHRSMYSLVMTARGRGVHVGLSGKCEVLGRIRILSKRYDSDSVKWIRILTVSKATKQYVQW